MSSVPKGPTDGVGLFAFQGSYIISLIYKKSHNTLYKTCRLHAIMSQEYEMFDITNIILYNVHRIQYKL